MRRAPFGRRSKSVTAAGLNDLAPDATLSISQTLK
jgi:hypothetical protein